MARCDKCGVESPLDGAFHRLKFTRRITWLYCPPCWSKRQAIILGALLLEGITSVLAGFFLMLMEGDNIFVVIALGFGLPVVFFALCILPHELGHAVAALALGMRLFTVCIGSFGKVASVLRIFGYDFAFHYVPWGGYVLVAPKSTRFVRLRIFCFNAAGPLVNALLIVAAIAELTYLPQNDSVSFIVGMFILANVLILAESLFPHNAAFGIGKLPSDGLIMLTVHRYSPDTIKALHAQRFYLEGLESQERGDFDGARRWLEEGLREYPNDPGCVCALAGVALARDNMAEARCLFDRWRELAGNSPEITAIYQNNIAWTNLKTGEPELLAESDDLSAKALAVLPWFVPFKTTRGNVLVELGRIDEGVAFLDEALNRSPTKALKACNACWLALAMSRKGNDAWATYYLALARRLDSKCTVLGRVEREVEERRAIARTR